MSVFCDLTEEERLHGVFQQDTATANMKNASFEALYEIFSDHIISHDLGLLRFSDLRTSDFYLWEVYV
jgi:hypothetical protein